jgi:hypothetical protein
MKKIIRIIGIILVLCVNMTSFAQTQMEVIVMQDQCASGDNCYYVATVKVFHSGDCPTGNVTGEAKDSGFILIIIDDQDYYIGNTPNNGDEIIVCVYKYCDDGFKCYNCTGCITYNDPMIVQISIP